MEKLIIFRADDPKSGYDVDCRYCLRGKAHTEAQHDKSLEKSFEAYSDPRNQGISVLS